jgi:hypothetical protein
MKNSKIRNLIKVAKNLKFKKKEQQITEFEKEELKEIYRALTINGKEEGE